MDLNIKIPFLLPRRTSEDLSGCGIIPNTFPFSLHIPAIFSREPLGLALSVVIPSGVQYLKMT